MEIPWDKWEACDSPRFDLIMKGQEFGVGRPSWWDMYNEPKAKKDAKDDEWKGDNRGGQGWGAHGSAWQAPPQQPVQGQQQAPAPDQAPQPGVWKDWSKQEA